MLKESAGLTAKTKTGSDPRRLPDYAALRGELSKLTHPARPDVNWRYVEKLCLSLFRQNGVDLQTAAWYTLARTQLAGLVGLNEGLAIVEGLLSHQWGALWPQQVDARVEILRSLSQRIQQQIRTLSFSYSDLSQLYKAEQQLIRLGTLLQRRELNHLSQLDTLRTLMHNHAARLKNSDDATDSEAAIQSGIVLPATVMNEVGISPDMPIAGKNESDSTVKRVDVPQPKHQPNVAISVRKWKSLAAGMYTMMVISVVAMWGWQYQHRPDPLEAQVTASLAPLPAMLTLAQRDALLKQAPLPQALIAETEQQLTRLNQLSPDWHIAYSRQLLEQAQALWPEQAKSLTLQWQQQFDANILPKKIWTAGIRG